MYLKFLREISNWIIIEELLKNVLIFGNCFENKKVIVSFLNMLVLWISCCFFVEKR